MTPDENTLFLAMLGVMLRRHGPIEATVEELQEQTGIVVFSTEVGFMLTLTDTTAEMVMMGANPQGEPS